MEKYLESQSFCIMGPLVIPTLEMYTLEAVGCSAVSSASFSIIHFQLKSESAYK